MTTTHPEIIRPGVPEVVATVDTTCPTCAHDQAWAENKPTGKVALCCVGCLTVWLAEIDDPACAHCRTTSEPREKCPDCGDVVCVAAGCSYAHWDACAGGYAKARVTA